MTDIHDEMTYHNPPEPAPKPVIVIGGDGYSGAAIQALLATKGVSGSQYEVISRAEAGERGLLQEDSIEVHAPRHRSGKAVRFGQRYGVNLASTARNPERDRWNAAVDEKKAAKRRTKGE